MVLFADRSLLASMENLLCLVMNLPICGCSEEPTRSLTPCYPEDGGSTFSKTLVSCVASHSKRPILFAGCKSWICICIEYCTSVSSKWEHNSDYIFVAHVFVMWDGIMEEILLLVMKDILVWMSKEHPTVPHLPAAHYLLRAGLWALRIPPPYH